VIALLTKNISMKKIILVLVCVSLAFAAYAQKDSQDPTKGYCEIIGTQRFLSFKVNVEVDFGQSKSYNEKFLVDDKGKKLIFNSMIDALNYMAELGWHFEQAYAITHNKQNVYHYLLSKDLTDSDSISEGFKTRKSLKNEETTGIDQEKPKKKKRVVTTDDIYF
jgi:hypothetical protein